MELKTKGELHPTEIKHTSRIKKYICHSTTRYSFWEMEDLINIIKKDFPYYLEYRLVWYEPK